MRAKKLFFIKFYFFLLSWSVKDLWGTKVMYCYVVKWPVYCLQRSSAKSPIAPSNFSPLWLGPSCSWVSLTVWSQSAFICSMYYMPRHIITFFTKLLFLSIFWLSYQSRKFSPRLVPHKIVHNFAICDLMGSIRVIHSRILTKKPL